MKNSNAIDKFIGVEDNKKKKIVRNKSGLIEVIDKNYIMEDGRQLLGE